MIREIVSKNQAHDVVSHVFRERCVSLGIALLQNHFFISTRPVLGLQRVLFRMSLFGT